MNTFKKALAITVAALTLGGVASTQAFAYDNCEHDSGYSYEQPREYSDNEYAPRHDYGYRHDHDRYEYRGHERHDYDRRW